MTRFLLSGRKLAAVAAATLLVSLLSLAIARAGSLVAWGWNRFGRCDVPPGDEDSGSAAGINDKGNHTLLINCIGGRVP